MTLRSRNTLILRRCLKLCIKTERKRFSGLSISRDSSELGEIKELLLRGAVQQALFKTDSIIQDQLRSVLSLNLINYASYNVTSYQMVRYLRYCSPNAEDLERLLVTLLELEHYSEAFEVANYFVSLHPTTAYHCINLHNIVRAAAMNKSWLTLRKWISTKGFNRFFKESLYFKIPILEINSYIIESLLQTRDVHMLITNLDVSLKYGKKHDPIPIQAEIFLKIFQYLDKKSCNYVIEESINKIINFSYEKSLTLQNYQYGLKSLTYAISILYNEKLHKPKCMELVKFYHEQLYEKRFPIRKFRKPDIERFFSAFESYHLPWKSSLGLEFYESFKTKHHPIEFMSLINFQRLIRLAEIADNKGILQELLMDFKRCYQIQTWRNACDNRDLDRFFAVLIRTYRNLKMSTVDVEELRVFIELAGIRCGQETANALTYFALGVRSPSLPPLSVLEGDTDDQSDYLSNTAGPTRFQSGRRARHLSPDHHHNTNTVLDEDYIGADYRTGTHLSDSSTFHRHGSHSEPSVLEPPDAWRSEGGEGEGGAGVSLQETRYPLLRMKWLVSTARKWRGIVPIQVMTRQSIRWLGDRRFGNDFPVEDITLDDDTNCLLPQSLPESVGVVEAPVVMLELWRATRLGEFTMNLIQAITVSKIIHNVPQLTSYLVSLSNPHSQSEWSSFRLTTMNLANALNKTPSTSYAFSNAMVLSSSDSDEFRKIDKLCLERAMLVAAMHSEWECIEKLFDIYLRSGHSVSEQAINLIGVALIRNKKPGKCLHLLHAMTRRQVVANADTLRLLCLELAGRKDFIRAEESFALLVATHPGVVYSDMFRYGGTCVVLARALWLIEAGDGVHLDLLTKHFSDSVEILRNSSSGRRRLQELCDQSVEKLAEKDWSRAVSLTRLTRKLGISVSKTMKDTLIDSAMEQGRTVRAAALVQEFNLMDADNDGARAAFPSGTDGSKAQEDDRYFETARDVVKNHPQASEWTPEVL